MIPVLPTKPVKCYLNLSKLVLNVSCVGTPRTTGLLERLGLKNTRNVAASRGPNVAGLETLITRCLRTSRYCFVSDVLRFVVNVTRNDHNACNGE